jgi:hypothetical protein
MENNRHFITYELTNLLWILVFFCLGVGTNPFGWLLVVYNGRTDGYQPLEMISLIDQTSSRLLINHADPDGCQSVIGLVVRGP